MAEIEAHVSGDGLDQAAESLLRAYFTSPPPATLLPLSSRDLIAVGARLSLLFHEGSLSCDALDVWELHVKDNRASRVVDVIDGLCNVVTTPPGRRGSRLDDLERFIERNPIRVVPSLGPHFRALFFTGPSVNTIVLAEEVCSDAGDMTFQIMDIFMHLCHGHLKSRTFDFLFELRRDVPVPERFLTPEYGSAEHIARKAACCLWDDYYSDSALSRSFVTSAVENGIALGLIRAAVDNRLTLRVRILARILDTPLGVRLRAAIHRPALYKGPVALVQARGKDPNVYLLCRAKNVDGGGSITWRRWIPSESIILRLGRTVDDVVRINASELYDFPEGPILVDPAEVKAYSRLLQKSVVYSLGNLLLRARSRLRGIYRGASGRAPAAGAGPGEVDLVVPPPALIQVPLAIERLCGGGFAR